MKKTLATLWLALCALALLVVIGVASPANAQTVPAVLTWTNPTTSVDGVPLTAANALTGIEVHWSTSSIADTDLTRTPQVTLGVVSTTTQNVAVANGSTLYFRLRAVNAGGKSGYSNQASKLIALSTMPFPPTNLNLTITVSQAEDGSVTMAMVVAEARELTIYNGG